MEQSTDSLHYVYLYLLLVVAAFVTYFLINAIIARKKRRKHVERLHRYTRVRYTEVYNKDHYISFYSRIHRIYLDPQGRKMVLLENGIRMKEKDLLKINPEYKSYFETTKSTGS